MKESVSVIIPAYNEQENIEGAVKTVQGVLTKELPDYEIIIIDDGSKDATGKIAEHIAQKNSRIKVFHHKINEGIGAAFKDGLRIATKYYVTGFPGDNDFSSPSFKDLVSARKKDAFVSSYMTTMADRELVRQIISNFYTKAMNILFGLKLKYYNGYFICPLRFVQSVQLKSTGFTFFSEVKIKVIKRNVKYIEIPFTYIPRLHGTSKALTWKSIFQTLYFLPVIIRDIYFEHE